MVDKDNSSKNVLIKNMNEMNFISFVEICPDIIVNIFKYCDESTKLNLLHTTRKFRFDNDKIIDVFYDNIYFTIKSIIELIDISQDFYNINVRNIILYDYQTSFYDYLYNFPKLSSLKLKNGCGSDKLRNIQLRKVTLNFYDHNIIENFNEKLIFLYINNYYAHYDEYIDDTFNNIKNIIIKIALKYKSLIFLHMSTDSIMDIWYSGCSSDELKKYTDYLEKLIKDVKDKFYIKFNISLSNKFNIII